MASSSPLQVRQTATLLRAARKRTVQTLRRNERRGYSVSTFFSCTSHSRHDTAF